MTHPSILVLGYAEAMMLLKPPTDIQLTAVIAIHGFREFAVETEATHRLDLNFDDIPIEMTDDALAAYRSRLLQRQAAQVGLQLTPPQESHAQQIIDFARSISDLQGTLLCQCQGGISRSAAAALLCLATWTDIGQEAACVEYLLNVRPGAQPHAGLVSVGDRLLCRQGKLMAAVADAQQG